MVIKNGLLIIKAKQSLEETIELIKKHSRNYAKRQYTWFNNQMPVTWFEVSLDNFSNTVDQVIAYLNDFIVKDIYENN